MSEFKPGDKIANEAYEIVKSIPGGGMAYVYKVVDLVGLDRQYGALKFPMYRSNLSENERKELREKFQREYTNWKKLPHHTNILGCLGIGKFENGEPYFVSEWMDGGSVADWIDSGKLYEGNNSEALRRILNISLQSAEGLYHAHKAKIKHKLRQD